MRSGMYGRARLTSWADSVRTQSSFDGAAPLPPPSIPGYEILGELGRGGMGVVYRARQRSLNRLVALKLLRAGIVASPQELARVQTEAEAVARLQHPNIVHIYEIGTHAGLPYLCLEYIDGPSLDKLTEGKPWPAAAAARLVETLAWAMHYAHQQGVVHRDLKPANVLLEGVKGEAPGAASLSPPSAMGGLERVLSGDGTPVPKIADFGLAKLLNGDSAVGPTRSILGTPNYMAPEQATGTGTPVGPAADIYALGAILYELLSGRPPFVGTSLAAVLEQVRSHEPSPPARVRPGLPRDLETICLKCLQKEPSRRYATAAALADDLGRFLAGEPIQARSASAWERARKWARRRPAAAALISVVTAGVVLFATLQLRHNHALLANASEARADARQEQLDRLERARATYQQFTRLRADAVYHGLSGTLFPGVDVAASPRSAGRAARQALSLAGIDLDQPPGPARLDPYWSAGERSEVLAGCYQMLFVLADAVIAAAPRADAEQTNRRMRHALGLLDRAVLLRPATAAYHARRAHCLAMLGDKAAADRERAQAAHTPPASAVDHFLQGQECYRHGDLGEACGHFQQALVLQPDDYWAQFFLALAQLRLHRLSEADVGLTRCLQKRPATAWVHLLRGFARAESQQFAAAERDFDAALALEPSSEPLYAALMTRGLMRGRQGRHTEALADFRQAVERKPNEFAAHLNLARTYQQLQDFAESNAHFELAVQYQPPVPVIAECHAERGRNLLRTGQHAEALQAADAAVKAQLELAPAYLLRGLALLELQRFGDAAHAFDTFLAKGGKPAGDFYRGRGRARMRLGDYLGARDDYTLALDIQPSAELWEHRGWAYFFTDAWKPALHDFDTALRHDPDHGDAYTGRGLARVMLGGYREAADDAEEALRRRPRTPEMMHNLACLFALVSARSAGDAPAAARYRARALAAVRDTLELVPPGQRRAFWRDKIVPDAALAPIAQSPEFRQLEPVEK